MCICNGWCVCAERVFWMPRYVHYHPPKLGSWFRTWSMASPSRAPLSSVRPNQPARIATPSKQATPSKLAAPSKLKFDAKSDAATAAAATAAAAAATAAATSAAATAAAAAALPSVPGYEIVDQKLGRGGFGAVYLAYAPAGHEVAIKVVHHGGRRASAEAERFAKFDAEEAEHEAEIHRRLSAAPQQQQHQQQHHHPAVVLLHELITEGAHSFLVLERVPGCELARHLACQPQGRLAEAEAAGALRQLASALAFFHVRGVAHMDLKTENVMRQPDGQLRLLDYGSAACFDPEQGPAEAWVEDNGGTEAYQAPLLTTSDAAPHQHATAPQHTAPQHATAPQHTTLS